MDTIERYNLKIAKCEKEIIQYEEILASIERQQKVMSTLVIEKKNQIDSYHDLINTMRETDKSNVQSET